MIYKIAKLLFIFLIISQPIFASELLDYKITIWGVKVADVSIERNDTIFNGIEASSIKYYANNYNISGLIFPVNNFYHVIINKKSYQTLYFFKDTFQPGLKNNIETVAKDGVVKYKEKQFIIPKESMNIFALLDYIAKKGITELLLSPFVIEREGNLYRGLIKKSEKNNSEYFLNIDDSIDSLKLNQIIENTDIFTWVIFKENVDRIIYLDFERSLINKCIFNYGFISVIATLKEYHNVY
tara:strand:- start:1449 stop:2168 length:720 start_codon:yes stop_codon:yes gene_type:complete